MTHTPDKVLVAMSGGVDSSVAAAMLVEAGYDVTGVFLCLGEERPTEGSPWASRAADRADARRVADAIGIDLFVLDAGAAFAGIIDYFADEYAAGRTPNPCVHCNARIKFSRLIARADAAGARYVATGHHARVIDGAIGRAADKDQSYALFGIPREHLGRILLPIGEVTDKARVRQMAAGLGLNVADKPDSQEICFVPGDYVELLRQRRPDALRPGKIVDASGNVLGAHEGIGRFTVGQRRGIGVAAGVPMYVTHIDAATATVTVGPREQVFSASLSADGANWHRDPPAIGEEFDVAVQVRYNHSPVAGRVRITAPDAFTVTFREPVLAVAPGQAAVVYDGERLVGGGWIR